MPGRCVVVFLHIDLACVCFSRRGDQLVRLWCQPNKKEKKKGVTNHSSARCFSLLSGVCPRSGVPDE